MTKKEKRLLYRILISAAIFALALILNFSCVTSPIFTAIVFLTSYLIIGFGVLKKAILNILHGQVFDENFLMAVATVGAFILGEYPEGVAVMLFYQVGELFESCAVSKSRRSITELMDIRPDYANLLRDGVLETVDPETVQVDDLIVVKPGERIPLDGVVEDGSSSIDTSALTGEALPRDVIPGDGVISGCINQTGKLTVRVQREFGASTVSKILELVETASDKKSRSEQFITRFARYYTPIVVIAAVLLALIPPLVTAQPFSIWVYRALTFLVISCPCALVISVPLSFFGGIGGASKAGILVKGSNYLELLAKAEVVVFDKTGTLTKGSFRVTQIVPAGISKQELLSLAAHAEDASSHPIARSISKAYGQPVDATRITAAEELAGYGIRAQIDGAEILAGNQRLMEQAGLSIPALPQVGTAVHLARDGIYAGYLLITDEIKNDAKSAIAQLKQAGIQKTVMLTGDSTAVGEAVAAELGLDGVHTQLLPGDKVTAVEQLLLEKSERGSLAFVGDGINDAPVLARADVGIAMGGLGSDAAIEAADVVLMTDEPSKLVTAVKISRKTLRIVQQNILFALGVKGIVLILGALGFANMWAAVFADVGVSVIAILNAMRCLNVKPFLSHEPIPVGETASVNASTI